MHLVPLVDLWIQVGLVEVLGEARVSAHPAGEAQVGGVLNSGLGGTVESKLCVCAIARLELLRGNTDLAVLQIVKDSWTIHRTCALASCSQIYLSLLVTSVTVSHMLPGCSSQSTVCFVPQIRQEGACKSHGRDSELTDEDLGIDNVADFHLPREVEEVNRAICQVPQHEALPVGKTLKLRNLCLSVVHCSTGGHEVHVMLKVMYSSLSRHLQKKSLKVCKLLQTQIQRVNSKASMSGTCEASGR